MVLVRQRASSAALYARASPYSAQGSWRDRAALRDGVFAGESAHVELDAAIALRHELALSSTEQIGLSGLARRQDVGGLSGLEAAQKVRVGGTLDVVIGLFECAERVARSCSDSHRRSWRVQYLAHTVDPPIQRSKTKPRKAAGLVGQYLRKHRTGRSIRLALRVKVADHRRTAGPLLWLG